MAKRKIEKCCVGIDVGGTKILAAVITESGSILCRYLCMTPKTGTAQNPQGLDHGWFVGFAPAEQPEIVVAAIMEHAEHGSTVAPFVNRIIARYLLGPDAVLPRFFMPADTVPEPRPIMPEPAVPPRRP